MITLDAWKTLRRVDHVNLGATAPRVRAQAPGVPPLDGFDADVRDYPGATNDFDRVTILGRIVQRAQTDYVRVQNAPPRYLEAVMPLYNDAQGHLNQICGGGHQAARTQDLVALAAGTPLAPRVVRVNALFLAAVGAAPVLGPIDATIGNHLATANAVAGFQRAQLTFARVLPAATVVTATAAGASILLPNAPDVPANKRGTFSDGGTGGPRLITWCNASGAAATSVDVVYVDHFDQDDVQGRTLRAGVDYGDATAARPIVAVSRNPPLPVSPTYPTTLAHEMGHALTGCPAHSTDPNDLMCGGATRNGTDHLSDGVISWLRNNPWT